MTRIRTHAIWATATGLALAGAAWAAIPDGSGTINGCFNKSTGALRVAERTTDCRTGETALSWSQRGPTGPQGATGQRGPTGAPGPAGSRNPTFIAEHDVTRPSDSTDLITLDGPAVPPGEYVLQVAVDPYTNFGTTAADVECAVSPLGPGGGLSASAHLDRGAGQDGAAFAWVQHGSTVLDGVAFGQATCRIVRGDPDGFLGFHATLVATQIG